MKKQNQKTMRSARAEYIAPRQTVPHSVEASVEARPQSQSDSGAPATSFLQPLRLAGALMGAALAAAAVSNAVIAARTPPLSQRLGGTFGRYASRHGDLAYTVSGSGSPVLLLHGLGAGNSMAEWQENQEALAQQHTVYAFDFLGWGLSDKPSESPQAGDYIEQVQFFVEDVIGGPCAVITSSQSGAFALEAAQRAPDLFSNFLLVCPFSSGNSLEAMDALGRLSLRALQLPVVGTTLYNVLASRRSIESFARHHLYFHKDRVDEEVVRRYHVAAHQPGSSFAVAAFLSGALEVDAREAWSALETPALLVWGRNALLGGLDTAPEWLALKPDARLEVIDEAMLLPHIEHPEKFNALALEWLSS